jgi:alkanesulfonate monooxygenase SsuD/methylene tetrahydromethanopterin reductase-like flavin-dependent oxidoreductase (luciferase family)
MAPSLPVLLSALAQRTTRLRLGTSTLVLALHNPLQVAEQMAMVDLMSDGRLELGIGRGFAVHDYEMLAVPYDDAQERMLEGLEVVLKAWTGERFSHHGRYFDFEGVQVWPQPAQRPHPPVWIACSSSTEHAAWTAEHGYQLLTLAYNRPIENLSRLTRAYRDAWAISSPGVQPTIATHFHTVVAEDRAEARRIAVSGLTEHIRLGKEARSLAAQAVSATGTVVTEQLIDDGRLIAGDPDDCVRILRQLEAEVGYTEAHCMFQFGNITFEAAQRSMELFATEVMPRLRESVEALAPFPSGRGRG